MGAVLGMLALLVTLRGGGGGSEPPDTGTPSTPPSSTPTQPTPSPQPTNPPTGTPRPPTYTPEVPLPCPTPNDTLTSTPTSIPPISGPTPTPGGVSNSPHWQDAADRYYRIRAWLIQNDPDAITNEPQDPNGYGPRLKDVYLIAFYISAEFHVYVQGNVLIYKLALATLYNEYQWSTICGGDCDSVIKQVNWLSNSEGWYGSSNTDDELLSWYRDYAPDGEALNVKNGHYTHPLAFQWGNYTYGSDMWENIHEDKAATWWSGEGEPYLDYDETFPSTLYAGFIVMSSEQAYDCDDVKCLGW